MINFNVPPYVETAAGYIQECVQNQKICGDGAYTKKCNEWIEQKTGTAKCLLTTSCTHATEMAALLADVVLPVCSWLEVDSLTASPGGSDHAILCQRAVVPPVGECKLDEIIFQELCERMGKDWGAKALDEILDKRAVAVEKDGFLGAPQVPGSGHAALDGKIIF